MKTRIKGVCFALAVVLGLAGAPFLAVHVQAYDSDKPLDTASRVSAAVNAMNSQNLEEVDWIAAAVRSLSWSEQKRLSYSTIRKLDTAHASGHGYNQTLRIYEGNVSSNRIPQSGASVMGATISANSDAYVFLVQERPSSSSVQLQFSTSFSGTLWSPVIYTFSRPANIKTSYDYYVKDAGGNKISLSVTSSYVSFLAPEPIGTFKIYRGSQHSSSDIDDPNIVTSFWRDVIDSIDTARSGNRIRVNIGARSTVPAEVLRALRGRSVTLALRQNSGNTVAIYGRDLPVIPVSRDYYTVTTLKRLYATSVSSSKSSSSRASSSSRPVDPPIPPTSLPRPASSAVPVVVQPPVNRQPPAISVDPSSSALAESEMSMEEEEEQSRPDIEIEAVEESEEEETSSTQMEKEEEQTAANPAQNNSFVLFIVLCVVASATGASLLTLLISRKHSKK